MARESVEDIDARLKYFVIRPEERRLLPEIWKAVQPRLPEIIDGFYAHASSVPHLDGMIAGKCPHLKRAQTGHWMQLFSGRFDQAYFTGVRDIGMVHFRIGLEPRWYVGGYQFILTRLFDIAVDSAKWAPRKLKDVLRAISTAVMLDMETSISVYQEALVAEREARGEKLSGLLNDFDGKSQGMFAAVAAATLQLQTTAQGMSAMAQRTRIQSTSVASASEQASVNVQSVASTAEELSRSVAEISQRIKASADAASRAVSEADAANSLVLTLMNTAEKITATVQLIQTIAGQTNLLALNATIEAARAGEAGKGFAVVASEVKNLANQTARATEEITAAIAQIQGATRQAGAAIESVGARIGDLSENTSTIATSVEQQDEATREIAHNVVEAAAGAREVAANISGVNEAAEEADRSAQEVLSASQSLSEKSARLRQDMTTFIDLAKAV
ncbi:hypothetical protein CCR94_20320 [Rhodoblastus sphagnicola]|uniref:Uncharacterized protein n=1 Tax=Rhodoblastus sphagnicola TaxID=333368 RepID=A0A2S6MXU6_9HYPH|nr:globin-coupled sensor protein [Rhodoblastus sphagnicola]MBB4196651.1 methyl-accepting chemotaxis protein [Rhodoblastus sphagnicola]PPQ27186.1 hypothetical protein CCR94_20320 [Rhodoblastus sphagnicola]